MTWGVIDSGRPCRGKRSFLLATGTDTDLADVDATLLVHAPAYNFPPSACLSRLGIARRSLVSRFFCPGSRRRDRSSPSRALNRPALVTTIDDQIGEKNQTSSFLFFLFLLSSRRVNDRTGGKDKPRNEREIENKRVGRRNGGRSVVKNGRRGTGN